MTDDAVLFSRAERYANSKGIQVNRKDLLGYGSDGNVWRSSAKSAIKVLSHEKTYRVELECYRRLKEAGVQQVGDFNVPMLEGYDDDLWVIEMSIVQPPYLLDFAKAYLDRPPPYIYDEQMMANAMAEWRERFGRRWTRVNSAISLLRKYGIYYIDPMPANICYGDEDENDS
jgi:hypothetical protein